MLPSPSIEDYLERILALVQDKGYARVIDIAAALEVRAPSVTKMVQKLDEMGYLVYEKYRGLALTPKGEQLAQSVKKRHKTLAQFLQILGLDEHTILHDVEGVEHHVSPRTIIALTDLVKFFKGNPDRLREFKEFREQDSHHGKSGSRVRKKSSATSQV